MGAERPAGGSCPDPGGRCCWLGADQGDLKEVVGCGGIVGPSESVHLVVSLGGGGGGDDRGRDVRTTNAEPLHRSGKDTKAWEKGSVPGKQVLFSLWH